MSELDHAWLFPFRFIPSILFAWAYTMGGREGISLWVRRILGSFLFLLSFLALTWLFSSFSFWLFLAFPIFVFGLHRGYGADEFHTKVLKRFVFGLMLGSLGLGVGIINGYLGVGLIQLSLSVTASLLLGVFNPFGDKLDGAVKEEGLIAFSSVLLVPFMI